MITTSCHWVTRRHYSNSKYLTDIDIIVQTYSDVDRLDLGRVGIKTHPASLNTEKAKEVLFLENVYAHGLE